MYTKLWKKVNEKDLVNENGDYFRTAWDVAMMFPAIEMAGSRTQFIPEVPYIYLDNYGQSDSVIHKQEQKNTSRYIHSL